MRIYRKLDNVENIRSWLLIFTRFYGYTAKRVISNSEIKKEEEGVQSKRQKYTVQFKAQVLERAERDGVAKAALDLGIAE